MDERKKNMMKAYLTHQQQACAAQQAALRQEGRADEAVFQQIRLNVFQLSSAVLDAAGKQPEGEGFFRQRMEQIPANWHTAREKALQHGNEIQAHLESIKLEAAEEIRSAFDKIWSDQA